MFAVRDKNVIQIEITNACERECTNCSRFVGHYRNTYFMSLEQVENAIYSLNGFSGRIGIMGGEPLMHPDFHQICNLMKIMVTPKKRYLWTSGFNWNQHRQIVRKTFGENVFFNNHKDHTQKHHPMLLSISDIFDDKDIISKLVDDCWVNRRWSASINPKGAFFCEIAAAMDVLFEGTGGHPVVRGWWDKDPDAFRDQIERYCYRCGACVPYYPVTLEEMDVASASNYRRLNEVDSPKLRKKGIRLHEEKLSQQQLDECAQKWQPWSHLGVMEKDGEGRNEAYMYGTLYAYSLNLRRYLRSKSWTFERAEQAVSTWLWRMQTARTAKPKKVEEKPLNPAPC